MSWEASTYVLGQKVGNAAKKLVLMGFANHAHADGSAAFPAIKTVADYAECSERSAQRHVAALVEEGWMREGDQELVAHYDPRRRPIVYDLSMNPDQRAEWAAYHAAGANQRRGAATAAGAKGAAAKAQVGRGDNLTPQSVTSNGLDLGGDNLTPQDHESRGDNLALPGVTDPSFRGDTGVTQTTHLTSPRETTPSSSRTKDDEPTTAPTATAAPGGAAETTDKPKPSSKRGTRLPEPFLPTDEMKEWVVQHAPNINAWEQHERFCDYFRGAPGQRGVKLDWVATWRNWMRKAQDDVAPVNGRPRTGYDDVKTWGQHDPAAAATTYTDADLDGIFGPAPGTVDGSRGAANTGTDG